MNENAIINELILRGHRSTIDVRWQSWGGYTMYLFPNYNSNPRKEFDLVQFNFIHDLKETISIQGVDDYSPTSVYFGRPLDEMTFNLPLDKGDNPQSIANRIDSVLPEVYLGEKSKLSTPELVINHIKISRKGIFIHCCYVWQAA